MSIQEMTFDAAKVFRLPFGKYKGEKIDVVAATDEGLQYLDWLQGRKDIGGPLLAALNVYLSDTLIADALQGLLRDDPDIGDA